MTISNLYMITTGIIDLVERTYKGTMHSSICVRKHQKRHVVILSVDKIVPAERPAGRGTGTDADLEIRCLNQVRN
jgi:hypothetical protein